MKLKYLCKDFKAFLQQIVYLTSRGYYYHCVIVLPEDKQYKYLDIDKKLINKYAADKSKYQRARQKVKKQANFYYLRLENLAVLMHTEGDLSNYNIDDNFKDIRKYQSKMILPFSKYLQLDVVVIKVKGDKYKVTVKMSPSMYKGIKDSILDAILSKKVGLVYAEFNKMYGLPGYAGIIEQEKRLMKYTIKQCYKHQLDFNKSKFRINTSKKNKTSFFRTKKLMNDIKGCRNIYSLLYLTKLNIRRFKTF